MGRRPLLCNAMLWLLYAMVASLAIASIPPRWAHSDLTNLTTIEPRKILHVSKREGTGEHVHFRRAKSLGVPDKHRCYLLFQEIHDQDPLNFSTDWLYAPPHWENSVLWDKTCPRTWYKGEFDRCSAALIPNQSYM